MYVRHNTRLITIFLLVFSASFVFASRYYDPELRRLTQPDPKWQQYPGISPYVYVANSPLRYIDPNGKEVKNPQKQVIGNTVVVERLEMMNSFVIVATGLKSSEFVIPISGGDRIINDKGRHEEIATKIVVEESKVEEGGSDHLKRNYGGAVDISTDPKKVGNSKVTPQIMKDAAQKAGLYPIGDYSNGHIHGEVNNKYLTPENYIEGNVPFVDEDNKEQQ